MIIKCSGFKTFDTFFLTSLSADLSHTGSWPWVRVGPSFDQIGLTHGLTGLTSVSSNTGMHVPWWTTALQIHVQLKPYPCLRLFLKKTRMSIPPPLPRVTITLGLSFISHIRRFRTFKSLKAFEAAVRLFSQSPTIVRFSHRCGGHLTTPGRYKTHHICCWSPLQRHHRVSPSERWTSERLVFDTSSILRRVSPWIQLCARCRKITFKT